MIKANLMYSDRDFDLEARTCYGRDLLAADMELERLLGAMSRGDKTIFAACGVALFTPLMSVPEIEFRQRNLEDARRNAASVRRLYDIIHALDVQRGAAWRAFSTTPIPTLYLQAFNILTSYVEALKMIRAAVDEGISGFTSEGFRKLYSMLQSEISDSFLSEVRKQLSEFKSTDEILISAELGNMLQGVNYTLRKREKRGGLLHWRLAPSVSIDTDSASRTMDMSDIDNRRDRALIDAAGALAKSAKYLESFFDMIRRELAFYIGCLNLEDTLRNIGMPVCTPKILPIDSFARSWRGLYDISLSLLKKEKVTGNEIDSDDIRLYIITGANQGGKSTFLRSVGQAQLMAQCGMCVAAESASIPLRNGLFSHYKREEDSSMRSGKLDEELSRLSEAVDNMSAGSMVLLNESFSSTNEREGSEICRQISQALTESGVEVFSVSHLYAYASAFKDTEKVMFLRAQRLDDGSRTFKIVAGEPLTTAFGEDLYDKIIEGKR